MRHKALILPIALTVFLSLFPSLAAARDLSAIFESLEVSGANMETIEELERYIEANPKATEADEAILRLARVYVAKKDYGRAADAYQRLLEGYPRSRYKFDSLYELGVLRFRTGKMRDARSLFESVALSDAPLELKAKSAKLIKDIDASTNNFGVSSAPAIGVLLPLKGGYTQYAEDALNGVLLAASVFGEADGAPMEVLVKDAGADPASVEGAISELSGNPRVAGLIGPLLSSTAMEAAKHAQMQKIPVITLSQKEGVTEAGDYVFRNFLTPLAQAQAISEYAVKTLRKKRFAVLYPQNNYGAELSKLFEISVKKEGGELVRSVAYPQGHTDFSEELKRIFGIQVKERKEGRRLIKEYIPTVRIDALYIPDAYESVALIAPYLDYFNIKDVQLLGSNAWNSGRLVELAGKSVEGAVFVDGFFVETKRPGGEEFVRRFKGAYGRAPGVLEAQAFDSAIMLIAAVREEKEGYGRESIKKRLRSPKGIIGATGLLSFDKRGEAVKKLFLLTVRDGRIAELN